MFQIISRAASGSAVLGTSDKREAAFAIMRDASDACAGRNVEVLDTATGETVRYFVEGRDGAGRHLVAGLPSAPHTYRGKLKGDALLKWYFNEGASMFFRSTFGDMLEKADVSSHDSTGKRLPESGRKWHWLPKHDEEDMDEERPDSPIYVPKEQSDEPSYTPENWALASFAEASRRLQAVASSCPTSADVLALYYGNAGERWEAKSSASTEVRRSGEGRITSLFPITPTGAKWAATLRVNATEGARSDELLANECDDQRAHPQDIRGRRIKLMRAEADGLLEQATVAWAASNR